MNNKSLLNLGIISLACTTALIGLPQVSKATFSNLSPKRESSTVIASQTIALISGDFVASEAPTTGKASIVEKNGQKYLEIDSAFSTKEEAPDLQVLLDTVNPAPAKYEEGESSRYLNLGGLQSFTGAQSYPIPDFVDLSQFKSVVIWCRMANATMGYASLTEDSSASIR